MDEFEEGILRAVEEGKHYKKQNILQVEPLQRITARHLDTVDGGISTLSGSDCKGGQSEQHMN